MRKSVSGALRGVVAALLAVALVAPAAAAPSRTPSAPATPSRAKMLETMKRATRFMVEKVALNGGYVWSYLPDMSRRWGEMEAYPTMVWVQPPGTPTMGHLFLDAYHATGDAYYYDAAEQAANALIAGQMDNGGWRNSSTTGATPPSTMPARRRRCSSCCASMSSGTIPNICRR